MSDKNNITKKGMVSGIVFWILLEMNIILCTFFDNNFCEIWHLKISPILSIIILSLVLVNTKGKFIFFEVLISLLVIFVIWYFVELSGVNNLLYQYRWGNTRHLTAGVALGRTIYAVMCIVYYLPSSFIAYFIRRKKYSTKT